MNDYNLKVHEVDALMTRINLFLPVFFPTRTITRPAVWDLGPVDEAVDVFHRCAAVINIITVHFYALRNNTLVEIYELVVSIKHCKKHDVR